MARLIAFAILIAALFVGYHFFSTSPQMSSSVLSPQQQLQAIAESGSSSAKVLGPLCENFPKVASQALKDHPINLEGTVQNVYVAGLGGRRAAVELYHGKRSLLVVYDLDRYAVMQLTPVNNRGWHFLVTGTELLLVDPAKRRRASIFACQTPYEGKAVFDRTTATSTILRAASTLTPRWQMD